MNNENLFPEDIQIENDVPSDVTSPSIFEEITQYHLQLIEENDVVGHQFTKISDNTIGITFEIDLDSKNDPAKFSL